MTHKDRRIDVQKWTDWAGFRKYKTKPTNWGYSVRVKRTYTRLSIAKTLKGKGPQKYAREAPKARIKVRTNKYRVNVMWRQYFAFTELSVYDDVPFSGAHPHSESMSYIIIFISEKRRNIRHCRYIYRTLRSREIKKKKASSSTRHMLSTTHMITKTNTCFMPVSQTCLARLPASSL